MYQVMDIGSVINKGLRLNRLSNFLYDIYKEIQNGFNLHNNIGKNINIFRCIPSKDIGNIQI